MLMVNTAPLGKKAGFYFYFFSLPRNDLHDTCCRHYFPPGHTLIDYAGVQSKESSTKCLLKKKLSRKHNVITKMIAW
jgi:hypothetical protein